MSAVATATVGDRKDLSDRTTDASQPQLAANLGGAAVAAWRERRGRDWIVRASTRSASGDWSAARDLSLPGGTAEGLDAAIGGGGAAAVVWHRAIGAKTVVEVALGSPDGSWSAPLTLSDPTESAFGPKIAVGKDGAATAIWSRSDGRSALVQSSSHPSGGAWTAAVNISEPGRSATDPQLGLDDAGDATAIWRRSDGSFSLVQASRRPVAGAWTTPVNLSAPGGDASSARLAVTRAGLAVAIWRRFNGSERVIQTSELAPGGQWTPAEDRSRGAKSAQSPRLIEGDGGALMALWATPDGLFAINRGAQGFGAQKFLTYGDGDDSLALDPKGGVALVRGGYGSVSGAFKVQGDQDFNEAEGLSPCYEADSEECFTAFSSKVAATGPGRAVAIWLHSRANHDVVQTVDFDETRPPPPADESTDTTGAEENQAPVRLETSRGQLRLTRAGWARLPLFCGGAKCTGQVTIRAMLAPRGTTRYESEARTPPVHATSRIALDAQTDAMISLRPSPRLRRAVARFGSVRVLLTLTAKAGDRRVNVRRVVTLVPSTAPPPLR